MSSNTGRPAGSSANSEMYELLIRVSTLTSEKTLDKRIEMRKTFVIACLSESGTRTEVEVDEIKALIEERCQCRLDDASIFSSLQGLEQDGVVQHVAGQRFKILKKTFVPEFSEITEDVWKDFEDCLKQKHDYDKYLHKNARAFLDSVLLKVLSRLAASGAMMPKEMELLPFENFLSTAKDEAKSFSLPSNFADTLVEFLCDIPDTFRTLFSSSYAGMVSIDLLFREQELSSIGASDMISFLLVDTCFLTALMCESDATHPLAQAVAKQCKLNGIPMYLSEKTEAEMNPLVKASMAELTSLALPTGTSTSIRVIRGQFVEDFYRLHTPWQQYVSRMNAWRDIIASEFGIELLPAEYQIAVNQSVYDYVMYMLPVVDNLRYEERLRKEGWYSPRLRDAKTYIHDAHNLALVSALADTKGGEGGSKGRPWFLTYDNLVSSLGAAYNYTSGKNGLGLSLQPRMILNYLLAFSKVELSVEDQDRISEAVIRFTIRVPRDPITIEEYGRLVTAKIGLEQEDSEVIKQILLESPLRQELARALSADRGDEAENVVYRIMTDTTLINRIIDERKTKERLAATGQRLMEVNKKLLSATQAYERESATRTALEKALSRPINISITANVDVNIKNDLTTLITILESQGAFDKGLAQRPDLSTKEKIVEWLKTTKIAIETSQAMGDGLSAVVPLITKLLTALPLG